MLNKTGAPKLFNSVRNLNPPKSSFDLSYSKLMTGDFGYLYPVMCDEVVPGDFFKIGNQMVIRFQPMVAPILHEINAFVHYFFVPYRLLWNAETNEELEETGSWEEFITGGFDGDNADSLPTWIPTNVAEGSLWDYLGFPTGLSDYSGAYPLDFPRRAYYKIYNEYYIDQSLTTPASLDAEVIVMRKWEKDYFTSALPWQQRGTAPALPLSGVTHPTWDSMYFVTTPVNTPISPEFSDGSPGSPVASLNGSGGTAVTNMRNFLAAGEVDFADAATFDVSDLRLAFQIQKWMERNARSGARYTEFLKAHFGVSPRDDRLQRPEYLGGSKQPIIISEVLQTGETNTTPQGNLAGHGISVGENYCGKYRATEFGLIMGLLSVMPKPVYQQGINRQWLRETKYDFFFPEFQNLSEQAILNREIFVTDGNATLNETIFGYQGRYDEMRVKNNMICGEMRTTFDYWHMSRQFSSCPSLNASFITTSDVRKDCFAAQEEPPLIIHFQNIIHAVRPLSLIAEPGLIDHN